MKPHIDTADFGSITVDGETFDHDITERHMWDASRR
jgi:hypothetical protein